MARTKMEGLVELKSAIDNVREAVDFLEDLLEMPKPETEAEAEVPDAYWSKADEAYICNFDGCPRDEDTAFDITALVKHLWKKHEVKKPVIEDLREEDKEALEPKSKPKTKRKVVKAKKQKVALTDLQKIALPKLRQVKVRVEPCKRSCPKFGENCSFDECTTLQRKLRKQFGFWKTATFVEKCMEKPE